MNHNRPPKKTRFILTSAATLALGTVLQMQTGCTIYVQNPPDNTTYQDQPIEADETYEPPPPDVVTVYQDDLSPYGSWVDVNGYGQCWSPANVSPDWQPYTVGHWEYSDFGWTWVAEGDEAQWGHLCYHYGRWYRDPSHGWLWIPGVTWAPAWVAWREGDGYCGWAPLPPQCGFGPQVDVATIDRYVPPQQYVYCNEQFINAPRVDQHFVRNNVTIINQTTNITNITFENNVVINRGISTDHVQRATGRPVEKIEFQQATTPEQARSFAAAGKPVLFAPPAVRQAEEQRRQRARNNPRTPNAPSHNPQNPNPQAPQQFSPPPNPQHQPPPNTKENEQNNPQDEKQKQEQAAEKAREEQQQQEQQKHDHQNPQGPQQQQKQPDEEKQKQQQKQPNADDQKHQQEQQQKQAQEQQQQKQQQEQQQKDQQKQQDQKKQQDQQQKQQDQQQKDQQQKQQQQQQQQKPQQGQQQQPTKQNPGKPKPKPPADQPPPS